jgi:hypothetical protein
MYSEKCPSGAGSQLVQRHHQRPADAVRAGALAGEWAPLSFPITHDELDDCAQEIVAVCKAKGYIDG